MSRREGRSKGLLAIVVVLLLAEELGAQSKPAPQQKENLGRLHHPITTSSPEARRLFDEGLTLVYAFNHEKAIRRFERAASLDPKAAMPLWGIAPALGPNINLDVDPEREKKAYDAEQRALALSAALPEHEQAYIAALLKRYSNDPRADLKRHAVDYANGMREVYRQSPDDIDAAALLAESLMSLHPWQLWSLDGRPNENTDEIIAVLEAALRRDPTHVGANHYYIHTLEASPHPESAPPSAERLETLVPSAGRLVHMPAHIYERTGDSARAALANEHGAAVDRAYFASGGAPRSVYDLMYYSHNLHFLTESSMMEGRLAAARAAVTKLDTNVRPALKEMPMVEAYLIWPAFVEMRYAHWGKALQLPAPGEKLPTSSYVWHFARGSAFAARRQIEQVRAERAALDPLREKIPPGPAFGMLYNDAAVLMDLAAPSLDARIAFASGDQQASIASWRKAVAVEDAMKYDEPPESYYPVRESLGGALLRDGRAPEAEAVFREDLLRNPRNPRSLFGPRQSLLVEKNTSAADLVHLQFLSAWKRADVTLRLADL